MKKYLSVWAKGQSCRLNSHESDDYSPNDQQRLATQFRRKLQQHLKDLIHGRPMNFENFEQRTGTSSSLNLKNRSSEWHLIYCTWQMERRMDRWTHADPFSPSHDSTGVATTPDKFVMCQSSMSGCPPTFYLASFACRQVYETAKVCVFVCYIWLQSNLIWGLDVAWAVLGEKQLPLLEQRSLFYG